MEDVMDEPRCCRIATLAVSPSICCGSDVQKWPRSSMLHVMEACFPTAGQSTCTGRFLSPLHACLSLNTWQVKPDSTGSGLTRGGYGRRRGDARSDPKCLNLCVHCMCGCSNLPSHRSFPSIPLSLFLSLTLSLFLLSKVTVILVVCSQAWIATLFCGRTMWGS